MAEDSRETALARLDAFIGVWRLEARFPGGDADAMPGRAMFEWTLDRQFVVQRTEADHPDAPSGLMIIGAADDGESYVQHYFDSRGVVRVYRMTFRDGLWTLARETPDFTLLDFAQRYTGSFSEDGRSITGRWEISRDGSTWERDFALDYVRVS
jgi:hypothetical protein